MNVAITRAKKKIVVFGSFSPDEIPTDAEAFDKNPDTAIFGRYMKYAHAVSRGQEDEAVNILNSFPVSGVVTGRKSSRFSLAVKQKLEERGYQVSAEIGTSGFYIDLGVHHPVIPTNFIIGVECDGAMFHSSPYARERDKIRQQLLESRGWRIERICSIDWSRSWQKEIDRIEAAIKAARRAEALDDSVSDIDRAA